MQALKPRSVAERCNLVSGFQAEFKKKNADEGKVKELKQALTRQSPHSNWKKMILGANVGKIQDIHTHLLESPNSMEIPLQMDKRVKLFPGGKVVIAFGSTFTTSKPNRINPNGGLILDAAHASYCFNQKTEFNGYVLAIADGAGGHFGDEIQDRTIARAAHFATKASSRFLAAYEHPDLFEKDKETLIKALKQEVLDKGKGESTTLACCRAFPVADGFRIVGFNIGDNMAFAWDPRQQKVFPIFSSTCSEAGAALLPNACHFFEIEFIDIIIPTNSYLYLMTDGVHDSLPHVEEEKQYPNGLGYKIRTLQNIESAFQELSEQAQPEVFLLSIIKKVFETVESEKTKQQEQQDVNIGDDISIIQYHLGGHVKE